MKHCSLIGISLFLGLFATTTAVAIDRRLIAGQWLPCAVDTFTRDSTEPEKQPALLSRRANITAEELQAILLGQSKDDNRYAQCAVFNAPLCHEGVCDDPKAREIEVFFKRVSRSQRNDYPNVFFIQGGPGAASPAMEGAMASIYVMLDGRVNVYTMDHRGTGRSNKLDCVAAQATTSGSPGLGSVSPQEVPECAYELEQRYGDLAAFSTTSAAMDLAQFISDQLSGSETYVYGVSYGTTVVERLIHLNVPEVKGYILDGIATTSGADLGKFSYFSKWDEDYGEVGSHFLNQCEKSPSCAARFKQKPLPEVVRSLVQRFDATPDSTCSSLVTQFMGKSEPSSYQLRRLFGRFLSSESSRVLIPPLAYRLERCNDNDQASLTHFFTAISKTSSSASEESLLYTSNLLYNLIVYSEMWEQPCPDEQVMLDRFTGSLMSSGGSYYSIGQYCAFAKEKSTVCSKYGFGSYPSNPILYSRDKYWNKPAKIPSSASVLLMSSKLDPQTPHKYAEYLFDALQGSNKKLVTFEHATHGTLWTSLLQDGSSCGMNILGSFVVSGGDLQVTDFSCVDSMPPIDFSVSRELTVGLFSASEAYDGVYDPKLSSLSPDEGNSDKKEQVADEKETKSFKTAFVIFVVLFVAATIFAIVFVIRYRRLKASQGCRASPINDRPSSSTAPYADA